MNLRILGYTIVFSSLCLGWTVTSRLLSTDSDIAVAVGTGMIIVTTGSILGYFGNKVLIKDKV